MTPRRIFARRHKYGAKPTEVDGIRFASKAEASFYTQLKQLERAGQIRNLELQPEYPIEVNGKHICVYRADFRFFENGERKVIDVKGVRTPEYRLKKKLVEALYPGTKIIEVAA
ncbi:MAG TPA: DUF1064 domain-containing protein [Calditerricola sp.]